MSCIMDPQAEYSQLTHCHHIKTAFSTASIKCNGWGETKTHSCSGENYKWFWNVPLKINTKHGNVFPALHAQLCSVNKVVYKVKKCFFSGQVRMLNRVEEDWRLFCWSSLSLWERSSCLVPAFNHNLFNDWLFVLLEVTVQQVTDPAEALNLQTSFTIVWLNSPSTCS